MIKRLVLILTAVAALATAVVVAVVAAAFALYSLLKPELGPAGASGALAGGLAVLIALAGLVAWLKARPRKPKAAQGSGDTVGRLVEMARERPIIAAAALVAGSVIAFRNPAITALVVKSFFDSKKPPKR